MKIVYNGGVKMMEELSELLEEQLSKAVEVKDPQYLRKYVQTISQSLVEKKMFENSQNRVEVAIKELATEMRNGFSLMEQRFTEMDRRFDSVQKQMDERFESLQKQMDERFKSLQKQMDERFKSLQKQMDERFTASDRRFESLQKQMDERFAASDRRFEALQKQMDERFNAADRRFEDMDKRFSDLHRFMSLGFTALALLIAVFNIVHIVVK